MADVKKFLDYEGVQHLWSKINMNDYPNNETLMTVINAIDETKADKSEIVQSDWNQSDPNHPSYILNKPFYKYSDTITTNNILVDNTYTTEFMSDFGCFAGTIQVNNTIPINGIEYTVIFDEIEYKLQPYSTDLGNLLGNGALLAPLFEIYGITPPKNTGEPFVFRGPFIDEYIDEILFATDLTQSTTHKIILINTIDSIQETIVKIPNEYLDSVGQFNKDFIGAEIFNDYSNNCAEGEYSHAEGSQTFTRGKGSHAEGIGSIAIGEASHAEGILTYAQSEASHAEGYDTMSVGYSHAEGFKSIAYQDGAHAEGWCTKAYSHHSHAEGDNTIAHGRISHVEGSHMFSSGDVSHSEGQGVTIQVNIKKTDQDKIYTIREHQNEINAIIKGSIVVCNDNTNQYVRKITDIDKDNGYITLDQTIPDSISYVYIYLSGAMGRASHIEGVGTVSSSQAQHVQGEFNIIDQEYDSNLSQERSKYAHIVGNGTSYSSRSNAHTLDWEGNAWYQGDVFVGGTGQDDSAAVKLAKMSDLPEVATDDDVLDLLIETNIIEPIYSNNNEIFIDSEGNIFCL